MPEVRFGPTGGYSVAFCNYCGWASNARDLDEACELNGAHERTHPEYEEPKSLEDFVASLHDHDCKMGPCVCICGCRRDAGCSVLFGPLCSDCLIASSRGDSAHDEPDSGLRGDPVGLKGQSDV